MALDANMIAGIPPSTREVLQRVAVVGVVVRHRRVRRALGLAEARGVRAPRSTRSRAGIVEPASTGYRFRHGLVRDALLDDLPPHRRRLIHRDAAAPPRRARRVAGADRPSPARSPVPRPMPCRTCSGRPRPRRRSARTATRWRWSTLSGRTPPVPTGQRRCRCAGTCSTPSVTRWPPSAYREALEEPTPMPAPRLRARLARTAVMSGDLRRRPPRSTGSSPTAATDDADILLARGSYAFFVSDFEAAQAAIEEAQRLVLAGERNWKVLDLVASAGPPRPPRPATGSTACGSSCAGPVTTPRSPTPSSTGTSARPSTCSTARRRTRR